MSFDLEEKPAPARPSIGGAATGLRGGVPPAGGLAGRVPSAGAQVPGAGSQVEAETTRMSANDLENAETVSLKAGETGAKIALDPSEYAPHPPVPNDKMGVNLILNVPRKQTGLAWGGPKFQVIYGNFAPTDPREVGFQLSEAEVRPIGLKFSRSAGDGLYHVQLNHYTVSPDVHAEIVLKNGSVYLANRVTKGAENRFEVRVNGVPVPPKDVRKINTGDMITLGIFRLKWPQ
jgi:hypothetical protein